MDEIKFCPFCGKSTYLCINPIEQICECHSCAIEFTIKIIYDSNQEE